MNSTSSTFDDQCKALCSEPELRPCLFQLPGAIVYVSVLITSYPHNDLYEVEY